MSRPALSSRLRCEGLETRETPAAAAPLTDAFDAATPYQPAGWTTWASNGQPYYMTTRSVAQTGLGSLATFGTVNVESRLWNQTAVSGNVSVSAAVRADAPAPLLLYARGANLAGTAESYVGVAVSFGGGVELRQAVNGAESPLSNRVTPPPVTRFAPGTTAGRHWLRVTLTVVGDAVTVRVQRLDTNQYLNAAGTWQAAAVDAASGRTAVPAADGFAGVGRQAGPYGPAYFDEFRAEPVNPTAVPQKRPWIRLAQLAYSGTPVGPTEQGQFRDVVDLTVTNPALLGNLAAASPTTPQLVYTNVSNIYEGLVTDWLAYADRTGAGRETAFYHVSRPEGFTGSSQSAIPVRQFWDVRRTTAGGAATDLTGGATGTGGGVVAFGAAANDAVAVGWTDRFREVNAAGVTPGGAGWAGVWEYSSTDTAGRPVWRTLRLLSDGTGGLTAAGRLTFDPPADWRPVQLPATGNRLADSPLYYVRLRTTAAGTAPAVDALTGRDYVNAVTASGRTSGTIPAFDAAADADRDGYLNDAEWANRRAGFEARFAHESRLFYSTYGQMRFVTNPTSAAFLGWAADYHVRQLAGLPLAGGLFVDNASGRASLAFGSAAVLEDVSRYPEQAAAAVAAVTRAVSPRPVIVNTVGAGARTEADGMTRAATGAFEEFLLRPSAVHWSGLGDAAAVVRNRLNANGPNNPKPLVIIDSRPPNPAGMTDPRWLTGTLSYYYLLADPESTLLMFWGGSAPAAGWDRKFTPQVNFNVGRPRGAMTEFATGWDPADPRLEYKVFARDYDNALVLFKPLSYTRQLPNGTGTTADTTATTHQLNGRYRVLDANGVPSPQTVTSVTLRNGEGVILVKV